jgi:surface protein
VVGDGLNPDTNNPGGGMRGAANWDTSNVTDMSFMFYQHLNNSGAGVFVSGGPVFGINNWNTSSVTTMESMFELSLIGADISGWNISSLTNIKNIVKSTQNAQYLRLLNWNVSNVTNMEGAFQSADIGILNTSFAAWNVSSATNMKNMFAFSTPESGTITGLSAWNTSNVTNMEGMFRQVKLSTTGVTGRLDNWDTGNVTNMTSMFQGVSGTYVNNSSQDLRGWCVTNIATQPTNFSSIEAWTYRPVWGTCP